VKFAADCMLGTLAKWLILLGHDVAYFPRIEDKALVRFARRERRTILTRDRRLVQRRDARDHILIQSQDLPEQVRQVLEERRLRIRKDSLFRRCIKCNRRTRPVAKTSVRHEVPPYVYRTRRRFSRCPGCRRIFWRATHVRRMLEDLETRMGFS
jgi:hypothetical protein